MLARALLPPLLLLAGCAGPYARIDEAPPPPPREFRAAWIATVHNIDWPSRPGLDTATQQRELLALLDLAQEVGLNAVVLQVRPTCDALYDSPYEPWSRYLTGASGRAPDPAWDPLAFAVEAAHARGLELHAWFNPYRARPGANEPPPSPYHVTHPESPLHHAVRAYGELRLLDPGLPEVQGHARRVILDVVARYDVDAVHMDDYFYPYPLQTPDGAVVPFPDAETFAARGDGLSLGDWRRRNVDTFVRELSAAIHAQEPWVRFGIAPFGIWRPKHPPEVEGFDAYARLAADSRRWLREGWVDYLGPQLYWATYFPEQPFGPLLRWWEAQNPLGRHLWPGIATRWIESTRDPQRDAKELLAQIELTRAAVPEGRPGHCHWNLSALAEDRGGVVGALQAGPYRQRALVPASPWLGDAVPEALEADLERGPEGLELRWDPAADARWVALQVREGADWRLVGVRRATAGRWRLEGSPLVVCVRPLSATGVAGPAQCYRRVD
ncbi:MAG: family 10 glycosylhydrolase [Planctomycetes bacterium]|nr:family 10 glycosylhydrolase [Planctomycetota bacterium]